MVYVMNTTLNENGLTFKDFEKKTFKMICKAGQEYTREFLESYDEYLMEHRDKDAYRNKGKRKTTVKTLYGEVEYERRIYQVVREDGLSEFVYLLDEQLEISGVGLISMNMAEQMVSNITEMSYRETAETITEMTGQSISAMGVWNVIQALGEKVNEEEQELVKAHKAGQITGEKEVSVLFEETDGIYVRLQREKQDKGEIKVGIAYDGWKQTGKDRYKLDGKVVVAGFSKSKEFQDYREASIAKAYDLDEVEVRIMNADGAEWIKNICDADTIFQLDPFHRNKAIKENIPYPQSIADIHEMLNKQDLDGLFEYLEIYRNSLGDDEEIEKAERLITYFKNNRNGLISYTERGIRLPSNDEGLIYRNMGTMENHVWSIIAKRMKHNHTCWSIKGGNHLAKILAKKCSGKLNEVAAKLKMPVFEQKVAEKIERTVLSAARVKKVTGSGYQYPIQGKINYLNESLDRSEHQIWRFLSGI